MSDSERDGYEAVTDDAVLEYGDEAVRSAQPAVRVAERENAPKPKAPKPKVAGRRKDSSWKEAKDGPRKRTVTIHILYYFRDRTTVDNLLMRLHGTSDSSRWAETSPFIANGVDIVVKTNSETVWTDLGSALHESGAVVVYWGHSERPKNSKSADKLRPRPDPDDKSADITVAQLKSILSSINAKAFIVAACASDGCIGKVKRDTAIVATDSGKDLLTNTLDWANALEAFLMKFINGKTITDCIAAGNVSFASSSDPDDRFVLASGIGAMTMTS